MTLVKMCPTCGFSNAPTSPFCSECRVSLVSVAPSDPAETPVGTNNATPVNVGRLVCPDCGAESDGGCDRCVYCDCALTGPVQVADVPRVELTWPWGKQVLTGALRIGRDPPVPDSLIKAINALGHDNISRSHADMLVDSVTGGVSVVDLGSINGTFVDGIRIPANTPVLLKSGAIVRFGANLSVSVLITQSGLPT